ncbi:MAG: chemotaxis-specific protein-glutamate methyltransferase CheB [Pirellulales bacterium]|nr:chemotaxis-specific protein-glutamate methyltransferase CheB [Pirellulales bacterium]
MVVDDSAVVRTMICDTIARAPDMQVVGTAADGREALKVFASAHPDVVTLDIQMPLMDGLEALDSMLAIRPVPVIMVSGLTQLGAAITLEALDRGAIEYLAKPERGSETEAVLCDELIRKIHCVAGVDVRRILRIRQDRRRRLRPLFEKRHVPKTVATSCPAEYLDKCMAIGISTGGPPALARLFESLAPPMPPIVVVQHMPPHFIKPLAARLDLLSKLSVKEAAHGDTLRPNHVLIAPGAKHLRLRDCDGQPKVFIRDGDVVKGHKPSIDVMMKSAADVFPGRCLGVIMTGMGADGVDGCGAIRATGGYVLGQDEASSDLYGMNKVAHQQGNVDQQFSLNDASRVITRQLQLLWSPRLLTVGH